MSGELPLGAASAPQEDDADEFERLLGLFQMDGGTVQDALQHPSAPLPPEEPSPGDDGISASRQGVHGCERQCSLSALESSFNDFRVPHTYQTLSYKPLKPPKPGFEAACEPWAQEYQAHASHITTAGAGSGVGGGLGNCSSWNHSEVRYDSEGGGTKLASDASAAFLDRLQLPEGELHPPAGQMLTGMFDLHGDSLVYQRMQQSGQPGPSSGPSSTFSSLPSGSQKPLFPRLNGQKNFTDVNLSESVGYASHLEATGNMQRWPRDSWKGPAVSHPFSRGSLLPSSDSGCGFPPHQLAEPPTFQPPPQTSCGSEGGSSQQGLTGEGRHTGATKGQQKGAMGLMSDSSLERLEAYHFGPIFLDKLFTQLPPCRPSCSASDPASTGSSEDEVQPSNPAMPSPF